MITFTGQWFDLEKINSNDENYIKEAEKIIDIIDITHSLSGLNRYANALPSLISVANHTLMMDDLYCKRESINSTVRLQILLHDATETYIGEIIGPVKKVIDAINFLELKVHHIIMRAFDFSLSSMEFQLIKDYDKLTLFCEVCLFAKTKQKEAIFNYHKLNEDRIMQIEKIAEQDVGENYNNRSNARKELIKRIYDLCKQRLDNKQISQEKFDSVTKSIVKDNVLF